MIQILSILGTYGLSIILTETDGPFGAIYKLRHLKGLGALQCFICTSVWVGAILSLLSYSSASEFIIYTFAYSGGAILLNKLTERLI